MRLDSKVMDTQGEKDGPIGRFTTLRGFHLIPGTANVMGYHTYKYVTLQGKLNVADRIKVTN